MALIISGAVIDPLDGDAPSVRGPVDLRIVDHRIERIGRHLAPRAGDEVLAADGGTLIPGLHDHHVHLRAWAADRSSVSVDPAEAADAAALRARLRAAPGAPGSWVRATGYHESVAGLLDRDVLDALVSDRPVRVQHRSGALWMLNSRALELLGLDDIGSAALGDPDGLERDGAGRPTGRLWRADRWLHDRRRALAAEAPPDLGPLGRRAAAAGVTGFTDATPDLDEEGLAVVLGARASGALPQRLHLMGDPARLGPLLAGAQTKDETPGLSLGPLKRLLDDDHLPSLDTLVSWMSDAHRRRRPVALHCVTPTQAALAVAAWDQAGVLPGDRMEHGAVLAPTLVRAVASLGLIVVTQPGFVLTRGDRYLVDVDAAERPDLWRLRSLLEAGVEVGLSSDAPFGPDDPWTIARTAGRRRTSGGSALTPDEAVTPRRALSLFCGEAERPGRRRKIRPRALADLVLLSGPLEEALEAGPAAVRATIVGGRVVHGGDDVPA